MLQGDYQERADLLYYLQESKTLNEMLGNTSGIFSLPWTSKTGFWRRSAARQQISTCLGNQSRDITPTQWRLRLKMSSIQSWTCVCVAFWYYGGSAHIGFRWHLFKKKKIPFKTSLKRTLEYIQAKFHWIIFHKRRGNSKWDRLKLPLLARRTLAVHGSPVHEAAAKTRPPKNFTLFSLPSECIYSESPVLLFLQVFQKAGFTLSTRITPIVCWRLILSPTSFLQPGHPAWMCLQHVIPLCGP